VLRYSGEARSESPAQQPPAPQLFASYDTVDSLRRPNIYVILAVSTSPFTYRCAFTVFVHLIASQTCTKLHPLVQALLKPTRPREALEQDRNGFEGSVGPGDVSIRA
jgi:hypothetical protein